MAVDAGVNKVFFALMRTVAAGKVVGLEILADTVAAGLKASAGGLARAAAVAVLALVPVTTLFATFAAIVVVCP